MVTHHRSHWSKFIIMGVLLFIVALLLLVVLLIPGVIATLVAILIGASKGKFLKSFAKKTNDLFYSAALSIDQFGNVLFQYLFNWALIKNDSEDTFGNPDETISSVLGKNERSKKLTEAGKLLALILHKLDPNHSFNSIEDDETH